MEGTKERKIEKKIHCFFGEVNFSKDLVHFESQSSTVR